MRTLSRRLRTWRARPLAAAATLAAAVVVPASARAQGITFQLPLLGPTSYTFTNTTLLTYRASNFDANFFDDSFLGLTERFDSAFAAPPWRLQIRLDGFLPLLQFGGDPVPGPRGVIVPGAGYLHPYALTMPCDPAGACPAYLRGDLRPEKIALRYQRNGILAEVGDFYTVFGRGVALAFRKVDPLGLDTTIRGGRLEYDGERVSVRAFGGYANPQNLDPITLAVSHDWGDLLAQGAASLRPGPDVLGGAEAAVRLGEDEDVELGISAQRVHFPASPVRDFDVDVLGYRASAPALLEGSLSLHGEVYGLRRIETEYRTAQRTDRTRESTTFGRGLYGAAQYSAGNWAFIAEWKDYTNFLLSPDGTGADVRRIYSAAPQLERDDVQIRSTANSRGGRLQVQHAFRPSPWTLALTMVGSGLSDDNTQDPWSAGGFGVVHAYATLRRRSRGGNSAPVTATVGGRADPSAAGGSTSASAGSASAPVVSGATGGIGAAPRVGTGDWLLTASAGYRHEFLLGARPMLCPAGTVGCRAAGAPDWQVLHADVDVTFPLTAASALDIRLDGRYERRWTDFLPRDSSPGYYEFTRSGISVTFSYTDRLTVSALARVDSTNAALGNVIPNPLDPASPTQFPLFYPAGEIRYMLFPGNTIRLFGGMTPGGRLCTGGVCRDVPPFQGAILEAVLRV